MSAPEIPLHPNCMKSSVTRKQLRVVVAFWVVIASLLGFSVVASAHSDEPLQGTAAVYPVNHDYAACKWTRETDGTSGQWVYAFGKMSCKWKHEVVNTNKCAGYLVNLLQSQGKSLSQTHILAACGYWSPGFHPCGNLLKCSFPIPPLGLMTSALTPRQPLPDEVQFRVYQYGGGPSEHPVAVACGDNPVDGHVHSAPVYQLQVDRPFEFRLEPRWRGGGEPLDVISEVKVDINIQPGNPDQLINNWAELVHHGPQTQNRELAQIGQHVTLGRGQLLHPMPGFPIEYHFRADFQLGSQTGPKRVCEGRVLVSRAP